MGAGSTGPFPDFTAEQWAEVRAVHEQFSRPEGLGRPLMPRLDGGAVDLAFQNSIVLAGPRQRDLELDEAIRY